MPTNMTFMVHDMYERLDLQCLLSNKSLWLSFLSIVTLQVDHLLNIFILTHTIYNDV